MSWMDSASGSSTFHGGGGLSGNNGNVGAGTGYGGNGGNNYSSTGGLGGGLSTGKTWYGNTAFGPSGGRVTSYATMRDGGGMFGMIPTRETYTNHRTPSGQQIQGNGKGKGTKGQQTAATTPGLLDDESVTVQPTADEIDLRYYDPLSSINAPLGLRQPLGTQYGVRGGYGVPGYGLAAGMRTPTGTQNAVVGGYGTPGYGLSSGGGWR